MSSSYAARSQRRHRAYTHQAGCPATRGRRQRLSVLEIATLLVIAALLVAGAVSVRPQHIGPDATRIVQVRPGDTLWSIAQAHPIAGLTTAQTAEAISLKNALASGNLSAGQTLVVQDSTERRPQMALR